jgi:hypothetical protein
MLKANLAIECTKTKDIKASEKLLESAKAQLLEQRSLIARQIDRQREQVERKISERRELKRRLKSEPTTGLEMSQLSEIGRKEEEELEGETSELDIRDLTSQIKM